MLDTSEEDTAAAPLVHGPPYKCTSYFSVKSNETYSITIVHICMLNVGAKEYTLKV